MGNFTSEQITIIILFALFLLAVIGCRYLLCNPNKGAIYSAPLVITSETHHTSAGSHTTPHTTSGPLYTTQVQTNVQQRYPQPPKQIALPYPTANRYMPMPDQEAPCLGTLTPPQQGNPPYPTVNVPTAPDSMDPPTYEEAMPSGNEKAYQKQSPFNPNFNSSDNK